MGVSIPRQQTENLRCYHYTNRPYLLSAETPTITWLSIIHSRNGALSGTSTREDAAVTGLEPATSTVTGWHSNHLSYTTIYFLRDPRGKSNPHLLLDRQMC